MPEEVEIVLWEPDQFPEGTEGRRAVCRFAPACARARGGGPSFPSCPDAPARYSERVGGEGLGGYARYIALCEPRALDRHGANAVLRVTP